MMAAEAAVLDRAGVGRTGVIAAFARLGVQDRDVVGLCLVSGFTPAQAAVGLGLTPEAVESRLAAALRRLRSTAPGIPPEALLAALRSLA
ncbi:hypothetical protein AX769_09455 [Frondihabitans sp. PAMC 28766]|uniref:sigma factor-like helix-turn-helix DNA-binding protein n=1 Tax=Frondihabitans sp. PAMC 28766 TaxID=1795630 RepID=UPI00078EE799|nr:sigma factor-like helix-turn-helix DNA-binding protein [Frondihabitans sp. PAMC 28766]AMM20337.1 hypothetical protein AX769_09455 [Frondihabitans sp. PAMC 28766]